jgi:hypothetical protein
MFFNIRPLLTGTGPCVFGKLFLNAPGRKYVLAVWQLEKKFIQVSLQKGLKGNNLDPRIGLLHGPMYK